MTSTEPISAPPAPPHRNRLGRNLAALVGGQATAWVATMAWTLVVPRILGPSGLGLITSVWAVGTLFTVVLGLGTENYLARELVAQPEEVPRLLGAAIVLRIGMLPVFAVVLAVFGHLAHYGNQQTWVLWLAGGAAFCTVLAAPFASAFQAAERMEYLAYSNVLSQSAQGLGGIVLVLLGARAIGLTAGWCLATAAVAGLSLYWIRPLARVDLRGGAHRVGRLVRDSAPYLATGLFFTVYLWIDTVMLSLMTNTKVVGWYAVPTKLFGALIVFPSIVGTAWLPRLVGTFERDRDNFEAAARIPLDLVLVLAIPIAAATALVARPAIVLLYGSAYRQSAPGMVILGLTLIPMNANIVLAAIVQAMKRQGRWAWIMAGASVLNPVLNAVLISVTQHRYHNGSIGASLAMLLTEIAVVAAGLVVVRAKVFTAASVWRLARAAAAGLALWGAGYATRGLGAVPSLAVGAITFVAAAWVLRIVTDDELDALRTVTAGITRRLRPAGEP